MSEFISFLKSRKFWKHFAIAFGGIIIGINIILLLLKLYTHHGQALSVPVFEGLTLQEAETVAADKNLRVADYRFGFLFRANQGVPLLLKILHHPQG
ncbi:MAG: hypothetical protein HC905_25800 [Bacteroidales bacterium]|nr:hypothetical protein [Bacteroidales bacterium]